MKAEKFNQPLLNMMNNPSSAADVWARKQPEIDTENKEYVDDMNAPPAHTYDELKKIRRDAYVKMVAIIGVVVTALFFGSVAWFTQSREVEGSALQMTASGLPFEIATGGMLIRNQSELESVKSEYKDGKEKTLLDKNGVSGTYYTSDETDSLILRFNPVQEDDLTTNDVDERYLPDIGPGSSGELNLYIIPKHSGNLDAYFELDIIGYTVAEINGESKEY